MITLYFEPTKQTPSRNATMTINGILIHPGPNYLPKEDVDTILSYDDIDGLIKCGAIQVENYPPAPAKSK